MPGWLGILLNPVFWDGYMVGATVVAVILTVANIEGNPERGVIVKVNGDVDSTAVRVRQLLAELMRRYGVNPDSMDAKVVHFSDHSLYVFNPVLRHVNEVKVYPHFNGGVVVFIRGFERRVIKRWLVRNLK